MCATLLLLQTANIPSLQRDTKDNMGKMLIVRPSNHSKATCSLVSHPVSIILLIYCLEFRNAFESYLGFLQKRTYMNKNSASLTDFPSNNLRSCRTNFPIKPLICLTLRPAPYTKECPYWGVFLSVKLVNPPPSSVLTSSLIKPHVPPASANNLHVILINRTNM